MYQLELPPFTYSVPWNEPYADRIRALSQGKRKVAFYYGNMPDNGTFRYRVYNMVQSLNSLGNGISAAYFIGTDEPHLDEIFSGADCIVICRTKISQRLAHAMSMAKNLGKQLVFDIDDLLFDPVYMHLVLNTIDADLSREDVWQNWYGDCARFSATLMQCDRAVTTNAYLAEKMAKSSGKNVSVIPNYLNEAQLQLSRIMYKQKQASEFNYSKPLLLGYFSGSSTHNQDFALLTDAFIALFEKYPDLKLRVVGMLDLDKRLKSYADRIEILPLQNILSLQKCIAEVDINLVPLQVNVFTSCKSELKYFEAGITGTISIASPTSVMKDVINDGYNGFLSMSYQWFEKIDFVLSNMDIYPQLAMQAYNHSERNYAWNNLLPLIEKTYLG